MDETAYANLLRTVATRAADARLALADCIDACRDLAAAGDGLEAMQAWYEDAGEFVAIEGAIANAAERAMAKAEELGGDDEDDDG